MEFVLTLFLIFFPFIVFYVFFLLFSYNVKIVEETRHKCFVKYTCVECNVFSRRIKQYVIDDGNYIFDINDNYKQLGEFESFLILKAKDKWENKKHKEKSIKTITDELTRKD